MPAKSLLLGVPYYGYDWPVTSDVPNATVQTDKTTYGAVKSVTYASARDFLAAHPAVVRNYDALEGSGFYTYWDSHQKTFRQVYFEEERSLTAKYDYAIATGLGGLGIWTLDNDRGYSALSAVLERQVLRPRLPGIGQRLSDERRAPLWRGLRQGPCRRAQHRNGSLDRGTCAGRSGTGPGRVIVSGRWATTGPLSGPRDARAVAGQAGARIEARSGHLQAPGALREHRRGTWGLPDFAFRQPY